ncbi:MAG: hypothetical protein K6G44_09015 [Lentisphaeria bacterium]|nr:hypothetical protein [Lentisphaeria bacterium]
METVAGKRIGGKSRVSERANKSARGNKIDVVCVQAKSDDAWDDSMARLREIVGKSFANVDVEEYVNSFRR